MNTEQAVTKLLDLIQSDLLQSRGGAYERIAEANDKAYSLSGGEQAIVEFAVAIWSGGSTRGSIALLGTLDKAHRLNALAIIAEYYGSLA